MNARLTPDNFWERVDASGDCWEWTGLQSRGYGRVETEGRQKRAHRFAYEMLIGPVPTGLTIDHLCRNKACVNPAHLEPVTNRENIRRGYGRTALNTRKTSCLRGHPLDEANTRYQRSGDTFQRQCRACNAYRAGVYRARKQTAAAVA